MNNYESEPKDTYECDYCFKPCKNKEELRFHKCTSPDDDPYYTKTPLDSPNSVPLELEDFAKRDYKRLNRFS